MTYLRLQTAAIMSSGVGTLLLAVYAIKLYKKFCYWNVPFVEAGRVDHLFIYPIKSCRGVEVSDVDCTLRGARNGWMNDREFLVVDELQNNMFLTARAYPKLVLVSVERAIQTLVVSFPDGRRVEVDLAHVQKQKDVRRAILHSGERTDGLDCGNEIGQAFTDYLDVNNKRKLRLLCFSDGLFTERDQISKQAYWFNPVPQIQDHIMYADKTSFVINTTSSLADLNEKLVEDNLQYLQLSTYNRYCQYKTVR